MLNTPIYYPYAQNGAQMTSPLGASGPQTVNRQGNSASVRSILQAATMKDSRWLTLEVCRQFQRNACTRDENECKFAHPPAHVEVQYGRVMCCYDSIKGKCQRKDPPCKYLHPPLHLREQLVQNGRNNLFWKSLQLQILQQHQHQHELISGHLLQTNQRPSQPNQPSINPLNNQNTEQPKLIYPDMNMIMNQQNQSHLQFLNGNLWLDQFLPQNLYPDTANSVSQYFGGASHVDSLLPQLSRKRPHDPTDIPTSAAACEPKTLKSPLTPLCSGTVTDPSFNLGISNYMNGVFEPELLANMGLMQQQTNSNCLQNIMSSNDTQGSANTHIFTSLPNINNPGGKRHAMIDAKSGLPIYQNNSLIDQQQTSVLLDPNLLPQQVTGSGHEMQLINALANATAASTPVYGTY